MRRLRTAVRFVGRWLGPVLIAVAALLLIFPPSPFFDASALPALAGAILSTTGRLVSRGPERKRIRILLGTCALAGLAFFGWRQWEGGRGYRAETVSFDNRGARLAGTLYLPDRPGKVPGIVWVHGSGPQTRGSNEPFAIHFARSGYAVLMFDKRGVGESTGRYEWDRNVSPENIDLLASDASAALSLLARHPEVRSDSVGFVGISQAGWITP